MFQELVSHNKDIEQLLLKGYAVALDSGHLVIRDIPYLDDNGALCWGAIVCKLKSTDNKQFVMEDHQIYFAGSHPHGLDGKPIANLAGGPHTLPLVSVDVVVQRSMSAIVLDDPGISGVELSVPRVHMQGQVRHCCVFHNS